MQRLNTAKLVLFTIKRRKRKSGFSSCSETSSYRVAELTSWCLADAKSLSSQPLTWQPETSWRGAIYQYSLVFKLYTVVFLMFIFWLTVQDYFSFLSWENICFADLCWNVASSLFSGNVSENAVPSRQGNSLYCICEHHLMVELLPWGKSPILWRIFFCILVQRKEITYQSMYLSVSDLIIQLQRMLWISVSSRFAFIAEVVLVLFWFLFLLFVQDEFVGWSQQSEHPC